MTEVKAYIVVCSWIDTATTNDHLECIQNYIDSVYIKMYPFNTSEDSNDLVYSMLQNFQKKKALINNIPLTTGEVNID